jgi:hypothetical protein
MAADRQRGGIYETGKGSCQMGGCHVSGVEQLGSLIRQSTFYPLTIIRGFKEVLARGTTVL